MVEQMTVGLLVVNLAALFGVMALSMLVVPLQRRLREQQAKAADLEAAVERMTEDLSELQAAVSNLASHHVAAGGCKASTTAEGAPVIRGSVQVGPEDSVETVAQKVADMIRVERMRRAEGL